MVISTPNTSHFSLAKMALFAGKHVIVDKPFTINTAEADKLIELAEKNKRLLTVYHNRRLDSDFITIQKLLESKLLGNLAELESRYDRFRNFLRPGAWREEAGPGAGIFYDLGAHLIDQCLTLFGLPEAITADLRIQRKNAQVIDNFEVIFHYPEALKVTIKAGMLVRETLPRFILNGDLGTFVKYGMDVQEEALKAGEKPGTIPNWGVEPQSLWGTINTTCNGMHITGSIESEKGNYGAFYQNVYNAITANEPLLITASQGRTVVRIIELAIQSNTEKRTVLYSHT